MNKTSAINSQNQWLNKALEAASFAKYVVRRFIDDGCQQNAAALTYMSLFAIVPLMTVGFAMFSAIPAFETFGEQIQSFIFRHFVPTTGSEVQTYLESFSNQARSLTGIGVAFLVVTAYLMLSNIEKSFNKIWRTRENRKGLNTFLLYWAILSLGPIMLGAGLVMTTYLAVFVKDLDVLGVLPYALKFLPLVFTSATFTLLFFAIPNCKVSLKHAAIGGLFCGMLFELAKNLFASLVSNSSYQLVYGTFATIPLFLVWLYFSWLLVLSGAVLVRALSSYRSRIAPIYPDLVVATVILQEFWLKQSLGDSVEESDLLGSECLFGEDLSREQWERLRNAFLAHKILAITEQGSFVLARDLHTLSLWDLQLILNRKLRVLYQNKTLAQTASARHEKENAWYKKLLRIIDSQQDSHEASYSISLQELFSSAGSTQHDISSIRSL